MKSAEIKNCIAPWEWMLIRSTGDVKVCCFSERSLGSLNEQTGEEIWNGDLMRETRAMISANLIPWYCGNGKCDFVFDMKRFDKEWYVLAYPFVEEAVRQGLYSSPWEHYQSVGRLNGLVPSPWYDSRTYQFGENASFAETGHGISFLASGWDKAESWGRRAKGATCKLSFLPLTAPTADLVMSIRSSVFTDDPTTTHRFQVAVNGNDIGSIEFAGGETGPKLTRLTVPFRAAAAHKAIEVEFNWIGDGDASKAVFGLWSMRIYENPTGSASNAMLFTQNRFLPPQIGFLTEVEPAEPGDGITLSYWREDGDIHRVAASGSTIRIPALASGGDDLLVSLTCRNDGTGGPLTLCLGDEPLQRWDVCETGVFVERKLLIPAALRSLLAEAPLILQAGEGTSVGVSCIRFFSWKTGCERPNPAEVWKTAGSFSIDFSSKGQGDEFIRHGFSFAEPEGVWTTGSSSLLEIAVPEGCRPVRGLRLSANAFCPPMSPVRHIMFRVNGMPSGTMMVDPATAGQDILLPIPDQSAACRVLRLEINVLNPISPAAAGMPPDTRSLGLYLKSVDLLREPMAAASLSGAARPDAA